MTELRSVRTTFNGSKAHTTAIVQVKPGLQLEATCAQHDVNKFSSVGLGIIAKNWSARIKPNQDAVFEVKRQVKGGNLKVLQYVPAGKPYLIPSPALEYDRRAVLRSSSDGAALSSRTHAMHDSLFGCSMAAQTLYTGPDRERKLKVQLDSLAGPSLAARIKLRGAALHSAAAAFSPSLGPMLQLKSRPAAGQKYSLALHPQQHKAIAIAQLAPVSGSTKLRAKAVLPLDGKRSERSLLLDLTWQV